MSDEGVRSPNETDVTQLFMSHYVVNAHNGYEVAYSTAKVYRRYDHVRRNIVVLGKFHIPEESGLPESDVTFMAHIGHGNTIVVVASVLNSASGSFENYVLNHINSMKDFYEVISKFLASAASGGLDPQNVSEA